jgi:AcrR family transcriptional regulator
MLFEQLIDRRMILDAALEMADQGGLGDLSMRRVATELGVTPMAIYRYVPNRAALLDYLADVLLDEIVRGARPRTPDQKLTALLGSIRSTACRHPELFGLLLRDHRETFANGVVRQAFIEALLVRDIPVGEAIPLIPFISTVVLGWAAAERGGWDPFPSRKDADEAFAVVEQLIYGLVDQRRRKAPVKAAVDPSPGGPGCRDVRSGSTA